MGSDLSKSAGTKKFKELCRQMNIVDGSDEITHPRNVGLLFFNEEPSRFFPQTQIDVVQFPDGPGGDVFKEKIFKGPLGRIINESLAYINSVLIEEVVVKHPDKAKAERFFNYPFAAIEESLVNAIYHRSYEIREPIEVRILPDRVTIGSFPGPDRSISKKDLKARHFLSRRYRNRRIGEFLKELDLTEGRGTGIPKIMKAIRKNGSPMPKFETDDDRSYFITVFPIHPKAKKWGGRGVSSGLDATPQVTAQVIEFCLVPKSAKELMTELGLKHWKNFQSNYLMPLIETGMLERTVPDKPNSRLQKYRLTEKGHRWLKSKEEMSNKK